MLKTMMAAVVVMLAGCAVIDTPCKTYGEVRCIGQKTAAYCLGVEYRWTEIACPGGCNNDACDFTGVEADVPCPPTMVDKGQCETRMNTPVAVYCDGKTKRWVVDPCPSGCKKFTTEFDGMYNGVVSCF